MLAAVIIIKPSCTTIAINQFALLINEILMVAYSVIDLESYLQDITIIGHFELMVVVAIKYKFIVDS